VGGWWKGCRDGNGLGCGGDGVGAEGVGGLRPAATGLRMRRSWSCGLKTASLVFRRGRVQEGALNGPVKAN
jgi:hypothetical protein